MVTSRSLMGPLIVLGLLFRGSLGPMGDEVMCASSPIRIRESCLRESERHNFMLHSVLFDAIFNQSGKVFPKDLEVSVAKVNAKVQTGLSGGFVRAD